MKSFILSDFLFYLLLFPIAAFFAFFYTKNVGPIKQHNLGLDFEYVPVDEGSPFVCRADPIGENSQPWMLSLLEKPKSTIDTNQHYIMVGYMMKQIRLRTNICKN